MTDLSVITLGADEEQTAVLQMQVDATAVAKTQQTFPTYPLAATDPIMRRIRDLGPNIVIVDIPRQNSADALRAVDLLRLEMPHTAIFAVGEVNQPQVIINAMRSGAREFLERPTSTNSLLDAFVRLTSSERKTQTQSQRGKVFTFINAKGGCGATTLAVNTAIHLQQQLGGVVLVDLAPLGHTALHLNVQPSYTVADALRNIHKLDESLMGSFLTPCTGGLQLLAGTTEPMPDEDLNSGLARLIDILVSRFAFVVVDASSRLDNPIKLVCELSDEVMVVAQTDVTSLWSAAKLQQYIGQNSGTHNMRLVMNRFRKVPGLKESEIETATRMKLTHCIPNAYATVANAIERGLPVAQQNHSEVSRAMAQLVGSLTNHSMTQPAEKKRKQFSIF
ncbi:MAG: AAA family ATPase [Terriglobales bacterium]